MQMVVQLLENFLTRPFLQHAPEKIKREMSDIVVMHLFFGEHFTELKPSLMQQVDFLGSEARSAGPR